MNANTTTIEMGLEHGWGGARRPFAFAAPDLLRHLYLAGQTGTGKSTALLNMMTQLTRAGEGLAFLDPHGSTAEELLDRIPKRRTRDVVYFNASDLAWPISINPFDGVAPDDRHLVASNVVEALRNVHSSSWGDRLDWILYNAVRALLEVEGATILLVQRLLTDERYRTSVAERVRDPAVRSFWLDEFAAYDRRFQAEITAPVHNKVGKLRAHPPLRNILGQRRRSIDARFMMDHRRILVANLSGIGAGSADLLGSLLASWFMTEPLRRGALPEQDRVPFTLVLDECQRFTTESLAVVLAEARKYGLGLVLAHQYLDQLTDEIRSAIFGNAGSLIVFRVGGDDAAVFERQFGGSFAREQFTDLERFQAFLKPPDGTESFRISMCPPLGNVSGRSAILIKDSQQRFGRPRAEVERRIQQEMTV